MREVSVDLRIFSHIDFDDGLRVIVRGCGATDLGFCASNPLEEDNAALPGAVVVKLGGGEEPSLGGIYYQEGDLDNPPQVVIKAETIERLWYALQVARRAVGDKRLFCPGHGCFWDPAMSRRCPNCDKDDLAKDAAQRLKTQENP
jgi:hypothetical protein